MFVRRLTTSLKDQHWMTIAIELVIVIVGVFVGTQVSNWNAGRLEKLETRRMLVQLKPNLQLLTEYYGSARVYYATTRRYATTALAGWRGHPKVSDRDFVIAAYQASQVYGIGTNSSTWATVLGSDQLRRVDDPGTRNDLSFLMSADYSVLDTVSVDTPYRRNVRRQIPAELQDAIRARCGDQPSPEKPLIVILPPTCDLQIPPAEAAQAATILRAHPELQEDLQWHLAAQAALLSNMVAFENTTRRLQKRIAGLQ
jgi:hypothetical protein